MYMRWGVEQKATYMLQLMVTYIAFIHCFPSARVRWGTEQEAGYMLQLLSHVTALVNTEVWTEQRTAYML